MEHPLRAIVHVHVPDLDETIGVVWRGWVLCIRCEDELWELNVLLEMIKHS